MATESTHHEMQRQVLRLMAPPVSEILAPVGATKMHHYLAQRMIQHYDMM
jgi:hypothetical protein